MIRLDLYRARAVVKSEPVQPLTIAIVEELPDDLGEAVKNYPDWERRARARYREQAKMLANALGHALPGGTLDALLVELLDRHRSLLAVAHRPISPSDERADDEPLTMTPTTENTTP